MKRFALLFAMLLFVAAVFAVPARRASLKVKQSDGSELTVLLAGDEALHFYTTLDGKPLFKELNGDYSYATFSAEGQFVSTKQNGRGDKPRGKRTLCKIQKCGSKGGIVGKSHR